MASPSPLFSQPEEYDYSEMDPILNRFPPTVSGSGICGDQFEAPWSVPTTSLRDFAAFNSSAIPRQMKCARSRRKLQSKPYSEQEWEDYRPNIYRLYVTENKTLPETIQIMQDCHGFEEILANPICESSRTYKDRLHHWGMIKNTKSADMMIVVAKDEERKRNNKKTTWKINGIPMEPKRLENFKKRKIVKERDMPSAGAETPANITYETPRDADAHSPLLDSHPSPGMTYSSSQSLERNKSPSEDMEIEAEQPVDLPVHRPTAKHADADEEISMLYGRPCSPDIGDGIVMYELRPPNFPSCQPGVTHVDAATHKVIIDKLYDVGCELRRDRRFNLAEAMLREAHSGYMRLFGGVSSGTLCAKVELGRLFLEQQRLVEAELMLSTAFVGYSDALGVHSEAALKALSSLSDVYFKQSRKEIAVWSYELLLGRCRELLGLPALTPGSVIEGPIDIPASLASIFANGLGRLAVIADREGYWGKAEALYRQSIDVYPKTGNTLDLSWMQTRLAILIRKMGEGGIKEAKSLLFSASEKNKTLLPLVCLQRLKFEEGSIDEQLNSQINDTSMCDEDEVLALVALAAMHSKLNEFDKAKAIFRRCMELNESSYEELVYREYGLHFKRQGMWNDALHFLECSQKQSRKTYGVDNPYQIFVSRNLYQVRKAIEAAKKSMMPQGSAHRIAPEEDEPDYEEFWDYIRARLRKFSHWPIDI